VDGAVFAIKAKKPRKSVVKKIKGGARKPAGIVTGNRILLIWFLLVFMVALIILREVCMLRPKKVVVAKMASGKYKVYVVSDVEYLTPLEKQPKRGFETEEEAIAEFESRNIGNKDLMKQVKKRKKGSPLHILGHEVIKEIDE